MTRERLRNRRPCERIAFEHDGKTGTVAVGFRALHWDDGAILMMPLEIFIDYGKAGSDVEAAARDGGLILSIAMQSGVNLKAFQNSITRLDDGKARA